MIFVAKNQENHVNVTKTTWSDRHLPAAGLDTWSTTTTTTVQCPQTAAKMATAAAAQ